jgi:hypothetical protein
MRDNYDWRFSLEGKFDYPINRIVMITYPGQLYSNFSDAAKFMGATKWTKTPSYTNYLQLQGKVGIIINRCCCGRTRHHLYLVFVPSFNIEVIISNEGLTLLPKIKAALLSKEYETSEGIYD